MAKSIKRNLEGKGLQTVYWQLGLYAILVLLMAIVYHFWKKHNVKNTKITLIVILIFIFFILFTVLYRCFVQNIVGYGKGSKQRDGSLTSIIQCYIIPLVLILAIWINIMLIKQLTNLETKSQTDFDKEMDNDSQMTRLFNILSLILLTPVILSSRYTFTTL